MRRHRRSIWASGPLSLSAAVICGLICTAAAAAFFAALIYWVLRDMRFASALSGAALAAGAYTAAFIYGKYRRRKGLFGGSLCGALIYIVLLICGIVFLGEITGIKKLLLLTVFGAAGGAAGVNSKRPKNLRD